MRSGFSNLPTEPFESAFRIHYLLVTFILAA
jgi:hypothetical protein